MKKKTYLNVSEKFYSIQGEGRTAGKPAIFLRLGGCNILCKSEHWVCDTIDVWRKSEKIEFKDVFDSKEIMDLKIGVHLVITGGEPLLHQKTLIDFFNYFSEEHGFIPTIEIETNGTIIVNPTLSLFVSYFNVSPKLDNSGVTYSKRFNIKALLKFWGNHKTIFKFVVSDKEDIEHIILDYHFINDFSRVWLMPAGDNKKDLFRTNKIVAELCKEYYCNMSLRLQVEVWDKTTGV